MTLREKLKQVQQAGSALLATNFYNFESLRGILEAAANTEHPVILQLSEGSIRYMGLQIATAMARAAISEFQVEAWLHLDHASSVDLIRECLDAGFDSVMIDASEKSFEENIRLSRTVVEIAGPYDAHVEAELGYIAKLGQNMSAEGFTQPGQAKTFVEETGIDALAVAIGSAHGFYKSEPKLDLELLSRIRAATEAFLVLHGGSGIPTEVIREAVKRGINKINIATETKDTMMSAIKTEVNQSSDIDPRNVFLPAIQAVSNLIQYKFTLLADE